MTVLERQMPITYIDDETVLPMQPGAGNLGLTRRSYERLYYNARRMLGNVDYFVNRMVPWAVEHADDMHEHRRIVGRIVMTERQLSEALQRSAVIRENMETAIPVGTYNGSPIMMCMWGINNHREQTNDPVSVIERETEYDNSLRSLPSARVESLRRQGYQFVDNVDYIATRDVLSLWGPIFDWSEGDIDNLRDQIRQQRSWLPEQRSVWFTAVTDGTEVVALAMAERLDMPLGNSESLTIVESTEWCVRPAWQRRGLSIGAASHVHAQILTDLASLERPPVIVGETNFTSRSDHVGHSAGMIVAGRSIGPFPVPQVLRQNVAIGDGLRPERLRDFTMMYIPPDSMRDYYSPQQRRQILGRDI